MVLLVAPAASQSHQGSNAVAPVPGSLTGLQLLGLNNSQFGGTVPADAVELGHYTGNMSVMVGLKSQNSAGLDNFLAEISAPGGAMYHHFISKQQFISKYSPLANRYSEALQYFMGFAGLNVQSYADRLAISLNGNGSSMSAAFHSTVADFSSPGGTFYDTISPDLPGWLASDVSFVSGLQDAIGPQTQLAGYGSVNATPSLFTDLSGYPPPISDGIYSPQLLWGSDMQKAYNVTGIINNTDLAKTVIATIFWTNGTGPFYPADVQMYFQKTLPPWDRMPRIVAAPLDGAPMPSVSAQNDTSGDVLENTLDLEMIGSVAPGSTIFNVYTPSNSFAELDQSIAYILNPGNASSPLNNVSVISNSWYSGDYLDPIWSMYLKEAAARGITVVSCSGDSGDNSSSMKYLGSYASFPGSASGNGYGVLSVGGTTVSLSVPYNPSPYLSISSESAWYNPLGGFNLGPVGSQGGISQIYGEPKWQLYSTANRLIDGRGRGVPDVAAVASYMMIFITQFGLPYYDSPFFFYASGTSVSAPLIAGIIADIDAYLVASGGTRVGFIDPLLYNLSNIQYSYMNESIIHFPGFRNPFIDIVNGSNAIYSAGPGYDLVTGLGSINAGNLTYDIMKGVAYHYYPSHPVSLENTILPLDTFPIIISVLLIALTFNSVAGWISKTRKKNC